MRTYFLSLWDTARTSYWFVPSLFAVLALAMSVGMPRIDQSFVGSDTKLPEWILTTTETARATLSAMAGAMIAVTGTVFSITVVTLSLTSQQFGPRLLRRFMYDLTTQVTLGVFLSTGFYCLLMLRAVESREDGLVAPHLSILVAVGLAVLSMAMLIVYIHHVAMLIQAPNVVAAVASDLDDAILRLFPERIGDPATECQVDQEDDTEWKDRIKQRSLVIRSTREGYVQAIDGDGLMHLACEENLTIRLRSRPGDFIAIGTLLADVWPADQRAPNDLNSDSLTKLLNETFITGVRRTPRQDVECAVNELVEVAVRSLSPGINDPFTAINCVDRLGASLGRLAERKLAAAYRDDEDGRLRVIAPPRTFSDVLDAAFNQIRQYGRESVAVTIRLLEALSFIAQHATHEEDKAAVRRHGEMIAQLADSLPQEHDRKVIRERFDTLTKGLDVLKQG